MHRTWILPVAIAAGAIADTRDGVFCPVPAGKPNSPTWNSLVNALMPGHQGFATWVRID